MSLHEREYKHGESANGNMKKECSHMNNMEEEKVGTRSHRNLSAT